MCPKVPAIFQVRSTETRFRKLLVIVFDNFQLHMHRYSHFISVQFYLTRLITHTFGTTIYSNAEWYFLTKFVLRSRTSNHRKRNVVFYEIRLHQQTNEFCIQVDTQFSMYFRIPLISVSQSVINLRSII